jgi:hypothetical protein
MKRLRCLAAVALVFIAVLAHAPAHAQQPRTFVSPTGSDSNPCTLASPCRTFQAAITQTNSGGEIAVLGTAGYNAGATFNIDRPISIVNPGGFEAGIVVPSGGYGITFSTSGAVYLRGLTIEGGGTGQTGIFYIAVAGSLTIQNCVVRNLNGNGIDFEPNAASNLIVSDTYVANNAGSGIYIQPSGGAVTAVFSRIEADNNLFYGIGIVGADSLGTIRAIAADSVATNNDQAAFYADASNVGLMLVRSVAATSGTGVWTTNGATIYLAQSTVTANFNGWLGNVSSYGNNQIDLNTQSQTAPPFTGSK